MFHFRKNKGLMFLVIYFGYNSGIYNFEQHEKRGGYNVLLSM